MNDEKAPWLNTPDFVKGHTGGKPWDWADCLAAELAVMGHRQQMASDKIAEQDITEFMGVYRYVGRMGLLPFVIEFLRVFYVQCRYGVLPDEDF